MQYTLAAPSSNLMDWTPAQIKALRKRLRYTQQQFADALGYARKQSVSDLERGKMTVTGPVSRLLAHLSLRGDLPADCEE